MVRLVAPRQLSGSWFEGGPRGLVLNASGGTARHASSDRSVLYRFNRFHQRGREPDRQAVSVLALGDSFTFGWLVEERESFVGRLEDRANRTFDGKRFQFLNAATGGWGTADALAYLESYGTLVRPKAVLLFINYDDPARSLYRGLYALRGSEGAALVARDGPVQGDALIRTVRSLPGYRWLVSRSHLLQLLRESAVRLGGLGRTPRTASEALRTTPSGEAAGGTSSLRPGNAMPSDKAESELQETKRMMRGLLRRFNSWCQASKVQLFVIGIGWPPARYRWLAPIAAEEGVDYVDLSDRIRDKVTANWDRYTLAGDGHPSAEGHALITGAAWPWLAPRLAKLR